MTMKINPVYQGRTSPELRPILNDSEQSPNFGPIAEASLAAAVGRSVGVRDAVD